MSKIEQKIPEGWSIKKLKDLSTKGIFNGIFNDPKKVGRGVPLINVVDLYQDNINFSNLSLLDVTENELDKYEAKEGDLLFTRSSLKLEGIAHCNLVKKYSERVVYDCHLMRVRTNQALAVPYYLYTFCNTKMTKQNFMSNAKTTTMTTIDQKGLGNVLILLPPLPEQEKIAGILSCWDDGIEKLSALIEKKKIQKKALMQQLLTGKHRLKGFSTSWHEVKLGDISKISTGESNREDSSLNGKYTFFDRSQDVRTSNRYLFDGEAIIVAGEGQDFIPKYFVGKFDLHQRSYCIMNFKNIFGKFLFFLLNLNKNYFLQQAVGSTVKSLRLPMFFKMKLYVPSDLAEQKAIAEILSKADEEIELLNKKLEAFKQEKKALMQQLLTGKIRVKVN